MNNNILQYESKVIRRNRKSLGEFFIKETKDMINQLCDDLRKLLTVNFKKSSICIIIFADIKRQK